MKASFTQLQVQRFSCGGQDSMNISIYNDNGIFSAYYKGDGSTGVKELTIEKMSDSQIEAFQKFTKTLKKIRQKSGCTSHYFYTLLQDGKKFEKFDGGCEWYGIERLIEELSK